MSATGAPACAHATTCRTCAGCEIRFFAPAPACRLCAGCNRRLTPGRHYAITRGHMLRGEATGEKMYCPACDRARREKETHAQ